MLLHYSIKLFYNSNIILKLKFPKKKSVSDQLSPMSWIFPKCLLCAILYVKFSITKVNQYPMIRKIISLIIRGILMSKLHSTKCVIRKSLHLLLIIEMFNVLQNILVLINEAIFIFDFIRKRTVTIKGLNYSSFLYLIEKAHIFSFPLYSDYKLKERKRERERETPSHRDFL